VVVDDQATEEAEAGQGQRLPSYLKLIK